MRKFSLPLRHLLTSAQLKSLVSGSFRKLPKVSPVCRPTALAVEELESRCLLTGGTSWFPLGPAPELNPSGLNLPAGEATSGRVTSLVFGTYNNQTALYAGSASGGVWRSTDFNTSTPTWTPLTDSGGPISTIDPTTGLGAGAIDVGSLLVQGTNLFVGTGEANNGDSRYGTGILKSIDGGNSWVAKPTATADRQKFFQRSISKIVADPGTGNLYAAVVPPSLLPNAGDPNLGVWQSTDGGSTWSEITGGTGTIANGNVITDLEYTGSGTTFKLYAAVGNFQGSAANAIYIGTPGGLGGLFNWTPSFTTNGGRVSLASDHVQTVYAAISGTTSGFPLLSVQGTTNNGTTWNAVTPPAALLAPDGNTFYNLALGFSPASGRLYLGLNNDVYESNKGVTNWRIITTGSNFASGTTLAKPHPDMHAFAFYPGTQGAADSAVYLGTDGGIWRYSPQPFDPADQSNAGNTPQAEVLADFDGDGKPDLAIIDSGSSSLVIRKGNGDGTFGAPTVVFTTPGLNTSSLVAADFNQDGQMDLAFILPGSQVQVMLNNGSANGTWRFTTQTYGVPFAQSLAVGHFRDNSPTTGAKDVDLVAVSSFNDSAYILLNKQDGSGTFTVQPNPPPVAIGPLAVATGDFNGDERDDIVSVSQSSNDITVLLNNGDGTYTGTNYPTGPGTNPMAVAVGDFNNDGKPDIAVANGGSGSVTVFLNDGTGNFPAARSTSYTVGSHPMSLAVGDFNGDGKLDLAVADAGSNDVTVLTNKADGTGTFITPGSVFPLGESATAVAALDLNGDRIPDLAVLSSSGNHVDILLTNSGVAPSGLGTWTDLNTNLSTIQVNGVSQSRKGRDYLLEGSQDNGVALTTNATAGDSWNAVREGDGVAARFDPTDATGNTAYASLQYGYMVKSVDNGQTWTTIQTGLPASVGQPGAFPFLTKFAIDPSNGSRLIVGSMSQVYETRSGGNPAGGGGNAWTAIGPALDNSGVTSLTYAPSNDNDIYVGYTDGRVFSTINDGAAWVDVTPAVVTTGPVTSIAVSPTNPLVVYISMGAFGTPLVLTTANGGAGGGWAAFNTGLPNVPVNALVLDRAGATLYAGTDIGVYSTATAAAAWARYGTGLPYVQVSDLQIQTFPTGTFLAAGTHGRGVWIIDPPAGGDDSSPGQVRPNFRSPDPAGVASSGTGLQGGVFIELAQALFPSHPTFSLPAALEFDRPPLGQHEGVGSAVPPGKGDLAPSVDAARLAGADHSSQNEEASWPGDGVPLQPMAITSSRH